METPTPEQFNLLLTVAADVGLDVVLANGLIKFYDEEFCLFIAMDFHVARAFIVGYADAYMKYGGHNGH